MNTPICDFVRRYRDSGVSRFHMPGHKGAPLLGCEPLDITEIDGADVLYAPDGIIAQSEDNATSLFGTAHSFYATEGSSLAIKAMLALAAQGKGRAHVLAARNAHKAFLYACALCDISVTWLYPEKGSHLCACELTARDVEEALCTARESYDAVYLTSPDYLGHIVDIRAIASVCHARGVPLLVDNAHGAYLRFLPSSHHPISLGADMCCDSAHKTLPVLTGGAYLHIAQRAPAAWLSNAREMLSVFASTSPSYLILQSLDAANAYLHTAYVEALTSCIKRIEQTKERLEAFGLTVHDSEPLKLVLSAHTLGYGGQDLSAYLRMNGIEAEYADRDAVVLMATPHNTEEDFVRLERAVHVLPHRPPLPTVSAPPLAPLPCRMDLRQALFSLSETVEVAQALGRICAQPSVSCPPAIPLAVSGEEITAAAVQCMQYYGITHVRVVLTTT